MTDVHVIGAGMTPFTRIAEASLADLARDAVYR